MSSPDDSALAAMDADWHHGLSILKPSAGVVDLPHSSRETVLQAARISSRPVVATHIGCAAVYGHPRCKSDEEIKAIAESGGYVGICTVAGFLDENADFDHVLPPSGAHVEAGGAGARGGGDGSAWGNLRRILRACRPEDEIKAVEGREG